MEQAKREAENPKGSWIGCGVGKMLAIPGFLAAFVTFPIACLAIPAGLVAAVGCVVVCNEAGEKLGLP